MVVVVAAFVVVVGYDVVVVVGVADSVVLCYCVVVRVNRALRHAGVVVACTVGFR